MSTRRNSAVWLAKQLSSGQRPSGERLIAALGTGGWPVDYEAGGVPLGGRGALFVAALATMQLPASNGTNPESSWQQRCQQRFRAPRATSATAGSHRYLHVMSGLGDEGSAPRRRSGGRGRRSYPRAADKPDEKDAA